MFLLSYRLSFRHYISILEITYRKDFLEILFGNWFIETLMNNSFFHATHICKNQILKIDFLLV